MIRLFFFLALFSLLAACNSNSATESDAVKTKPFFDLAGYIAQQVEAAPWKSREVSKTITINDETEHKKLKSPDLASDLKIFSKADINKPAWVDKYRIETVDNDTTYIATDSSLRTQRLQVLRDPNNQVERIEIKRRSGNLLSKGQQELTYTPNKGYRIQADQIGELVGNASVLVEVEFK